LRIREVPVRWENDARSKARLRQLPREAWHVCHLWQQFRQVEKPVTISSVGYEY
jgi:hypothetical protein